MAESVRTHSTFKVIIHAKHTNGVCVECGLQMEVRDVDIGGKVRKRAVCANCGGMTGQLIAMPISVQAPEPPQCISLKCLGKFIIDSLFVAFLSSYHRRRVAYAEANRPEKGKKILERYRTGEHAPTSLMGAVVANIKLTCPFCRRVETKW